MIETYSDPIERNRNIADFVSGIKKALANSF
jgi:hypothetical protein